MSIIASVPPADHDHGLVAFTSSSSSASVVSSTPVSEFSDVSSSSSAFIPLPGLDSDSTESSINFGSTPGTQESISAPFNPTSSDSDVATFSPTSIDSDVATSSSSQPDPSNSGSSPTAAAGSSATSIKASLDNSLLSSPFISASTSPSTVGPSPLGSPPTRSTVTAHHVSSGTIGGIIAGLALLLLLVISTSLVVRRRKRRETVYRVFETIAQPYDVGGEHTDKPGLTADSASHPSPLPSVRITSQARRKNQQRQHVPIAQRPSDHTTRSPESDTPLGGGGSPVSEQAALPEQTLDDDNRRATDPSGNRPVAGEVPSLPGLIERLNRAIQLLEARPGVTTVNAEEQPPQYEE